MNNLKLPIDISANTDFLPSVSESFSAFGHIADMYARTLAYKLETKRLDAELKNIEIQAKLAHHTIERSFELKMEELLQKRAALMGFYQTVNNELNNLHIERTTVLRMAEHAQKQALDKDLPLEARQLASNMAMELVKQLPSFSEQANQSIQQLVQALPSVEMPAKLLK